MQIAVITASMNKWLSDKKWQFCPTNTGVRGGLKGIKKPPCSKQHSRAFLKPSVFASLIFITDPDYFSFHAVCHFMLFCGQLHIQIGFGLVNSHYCSIRKPWLLWSRAYGLRQQYKQTLYSRALNQKTPYLLWNTARST